MSEHGNGNGCTAVAAGAHQGRLLLRPGDALVPGLRRLRDPGLGPGLHARARRPAGEDRVRHRDRLRGALRLLHGHLRDARHPWPRARACDRGGDLAPGPLGVGRLRRWRRALDRRQPPDPRPAPQRAAEDPALQQPDLRAHEGPVLAHERGGQGHEVHAVRLAGPSLQPGLAGARRRGDVRRAHGRHRQGAHGRDAARRRGARGRGLRRDLPELQRLQRRRLRRRARQGTEGAQPDPPRARRADPLRARGRARRRARRRRPARAGRRGRRRARRPSWSTTPTAASPSLAFELAHLAARPPAPRRSACFAGQAPGLRRASWRESLEEERAAVGREQLEELLHSGETWTVS